MLSRRILCSRVPILIRQFDKNQLYLTSNLNSESCYSTLSQKIFRYDFDQPSIFESQTNLSVQHVRNLSSFSVLFARKSTSESESGQDEKEYMAKGDKILRLKLKTTRLDGVLKEGLGISKNKIEKAFYEDKIRVNGDRPRKKSQLMNEGDEIDLIRGRNEKNMEFLDISRVEIVKIGTTSTSKDDEDEEDDPEDYRIPAVLKRYKSLTVQNYGQAFKGGTDE